MTILALFGLTPGNIALLLEMTTRRRTEMEPRDHYDRWAKSLRKAAYVSKPSNLRTLGIGGDRWVPKKVVGKIKGVIPWRMYYWVFVKTRRFSWSEPYLIPQEMASDLFRRVLWVDCRGFTKVGPIYYPVPTESYPVPIDKYTRRILEAFRFAFEQQTFSDIQENVAWAIDHGVNPPIKDRARVTEADSPGYVDREYIAEEKATGGDSL